MPVKHGLLRSSCYSLLNIAPYRSVEFKGVLKQKLKWVFSGWSILLGRCWWPWSNHIWIILYYSRSKSNSCPSPKICVNISAVHLVTDGDRVGWIVTFERLEWILVSLSLVRGLPYQYNLLGALTDNPAPADLTISKRNFLSLYALANCYADRAVFDCWEILDKIHIWSRALDFRNFVLNYFFNIEKKNNYSIEILLC